MEKIITNAREGHRITQIRVSSPERRGEILERYLVPSGLLETCAPTHPRAFSLDGKDDVWYIDPVPCFIVQHRGTAIYALDSVNVVLALAGS